MVINDIKLGTKLAYHIANRSHVLTVAEIHLHSQHDSFEIIFTDGTIIGDFGIFKDLSEFPYLDLA